MAALFRSRLINISSISVLNRIHYTIPRPFHTMGSLKVENKGAPDVPFYTPAQEPPAGSTDQSDVTLFTPLKVRSVETHNRFVVSPMCMYSADNGHLTDFHLVHLGQLALHGAGMVMVEATAVEPQGRISPEDSGLWQDSQIEPLKRIVDFMHSQNTKAAIQIAHAGRKASTLAPWLTERHQKTLADESAGGWADDVRGASAIPFGDGYAVPKELTKEGIKEIVQKFADTAKRAVKAGFDVIEIHGAHGYLISSFLSPLSNQRTDEYGGSFENRTRFAREVITAVRAVIPEDMPLWFRISATEWVEYAGEPSWDLESTTRFAKELPALGVDVLDVSSGGNNINQQIKISPTFQTQFAKHIRQAIQKDGLNLKIGAVGFINNGEFAKDVVQAGPDASADYALVARQFLREPEFVLRAAHENKVRAKWPNQYHRAGPRRDFESKF